MRQSQRGTYRSRRANTMSGFWTQQVARKDSGRKRTSDDGENSENTINADLDCCRNERCKTRLHDMNNTAFQHLTSTGERKLAILSPHRVKRPWQDPPPGWIRPLAGSGLCSKPAPGWIRPPAGSGPWLDPAPGWIRPPTGPGTGWSPGRWLDPALWL